MRSLIGFLIAVLSLDASAGSAGRGTLSLVHFIRNGVVIAYTDGARADVPSCAVSQPRRFAVDATSSEGKVLLSGLLSAYALGKQVTVVGAGTCLPQQEDTEAISYFYTED